MRGQCNVIVDQTKNRYSGAAMSVTHTSKVFAFSTKSGSFETSTKSLAVDIRSNRIGKFVVV